MDRNSEGTARREAELEGTAGDGPPEGKEAASPEDHKLPDDQEAMQPDSS